MSAANLPIRIAGSGPSGLAAAITLARAGYEVHVHDMRNDCGERFSGDMQGLENWSYHENVIDDLGTMGITVNFDCDPFTRITIANGSITQELKLDQPLFYLVKRGAIAGSLDQGLKKQALDAGVHFHFRSKLQPKQADIIATGPILSQVVGIVKGIVFTTKLPDLAIGVMHNPAGFMGYAYLLVTKGYGCLCTVLLDRFQEVNACFENAKELLAKLVPLDIRQPKHVGGVGCFTLTNVWERDGRRYVGEAAGLQDFLWGFGIRSSIRSGWLAAQSIIEDNSYERFVHRHFQKRNKAAIVNRYLWEKFSEHDYGTAMYRLKAHNPFRLLRSFYNFNLLQRALYPFALRRIRQRYLKLDAG